MYRDHKLGIEILNSCTRKIAFSQDGYPIAFEEGHGTGFSSIRAIVEKYGAEMICEQRDGLFSVTCLFYL
ncbi:MAG: GHKL domain-containing protein [bacterium]|nr:GHKL domain-containing protein [bacterium]